MRMRRGPGLVGAAARTAVVVGTAGAVSNRQQKKYAAKDAAAQEQQAATQTPPAAEAEAEPSYMAELEQLAKLRDQGILTPEEFDAKKAQILGL